MKRELTNQERELTEKGVKRNEDEIREISQALEIMELHQQFLMNKREYEDKVRPFNRAKEDKEVEQSIKGYQSEIKMKIEIIESLKTQLNEGVTVKEPDIPSGVN